MKNFRISFIAVFLLICLSGCSSAPPQAKPRVTADKGYADTNKIIKSDRLKQGGKIVIVPPTAGNGVEASDALDKISLMVVKGIADVLQENAPDFTILTADNAQEAELILRGHVVKIERPPRGVKKWMPGQKITKLKVTGEIVEKDKKSRVLVFSQKSQINSTDDKKLGYEVGRQIGQFIVSGLQ